MTVSVSANRVSARVTKWAVESEAAPASPVPTSCCVTSASTVANTWARRPRRGSLSMRAVGPRRSWRTLAGSADVVAVESVVSLVAGGVASVVVGVGVGGGGGGDGGGTAAGGISNL